MKRLHVRRGDTVYVNAGSYRGTKGKVLQVFPEKERAIVEGVNMVAKHTKPSAQYPQGGIIRKEAPIHVSNVQVLDKNGVAGRVGYKVVDGKKVRYNKKSGEVLD